MSLVVSFGVAPSIAEAQDRADKVLATNKTSTLQKELQEAAETGYDAVGVTVGKTALGGAEIVVITRKPIR